MEELVRTGAVDSLDLKGQYKDTPVDVDTDPELYRMVIEAFPHAWLEDPDVTDETLPFLEPVAERVTWDAPIHSVADVLDRPWRPRMVNIRPPLRPAQQPVRDVRLVRAGGTGVRRRPDRARPGPRPHQYLASLFHPDTPNDTAPSGYNEPKLRTGSFRARSSRVAPAGCWQQ